MTNTTNIETITEQKAAMMINRIDFIKDRFGDDGLADVLAALREDQRVRLTQPLLSSQWLSMDTSADFLEAVLKTVAKGDEQVIVEMGRFSAEKALSGIYRMFVKFGSASFIIGRGAAVFRTMFNGGQSKAESLGPKEALWTSEGFTTHHRLIEVVMYGWMIRALELSGAKNVKATVVTSLKGGKGKFEIKGVWE